MSVHALEAAGAGDGDAIIAVKRRPTYAHLEWAAKLAPLAGTDKVRTVKVPARLVRRAETVIARSGLADYLQTHLPEPENRPTGGAKRILSVDAVLLGFVMLALTEQAMIIRDAVDLLNGLHPSTKHRLDIPQRDPATGRGGVTERMVSRLFNQIADVLDPSPHTRNNLLPLREAHQAIREAHPGQDPETRALRKELHQRIEADHQVELAEKLDRLRYVLDRGLDATLPDEPHTGSYAVDCTEVESWALQYRRQPLRPELYADPDARHNGKGDGWFGYWLHGVVRVGEVGQAAGPCFVESIELTAANADIRVAGLELIERMSADHEYADEQAGRDPRPRRDILADRAYTSETKTAEDWIWPLFDMGYDSVHALTERQLGMRKAKTSTGAIVVDGQPASPRMPKQLRNIAFPPVSATRAELDAYRNEIAKRTPWMLHPVGGRADDGSWDFGCRAMSVLGQVRCDLKPASMTKPATPNRPTADPTLFKPRTLRRDLHAICLQQTARTPATDLPFWQKDQFGSQAWFDSWNRRNRVEGLFGNIKNDAAQNLTRGRIRVMGLAKVSLMALFIAIAANLRLADTHKAARERDEVEALAAAAGAQKKKRKPRWRTQLRMEMRERMEERAAARGQRDAAAGVNPHERPPLVDPPAVVPDPPPVE